MIVCRNLQNRKIGGSTTFKEWRCKYKPDFYCSKRKESGGKVEPMPRPETGIHC